MTLRSPALPAWWPGLLLALAVAAVALWLGQSQWASALGLSALTLAIVLGMLLGNTPYAPGPQFAAGLQLSKGPLLRAGIVLYGLRLTWQQLLGVGVPGLLAASAMLVTTFLLAQWLGRLLGIDRETRALIGAGSSICGAAAVLATAPVVQARSEQVTVAVSTVVLFGTLAMVLYPALYHAALWPLGEQGFGIYIGASVHEVAQVVAAGKAVGPVAADAAVTTKMLRVVLLAPFLLLLPAWYRRSATDSARLPVPIPWFAFGFLGVAALHSLNWLPAGAVSGLLTLDNLLLTLAMAALGLTTRLSTLREAGLRPLALAGALMLWLVLGGGLLTTWLEALF
ncbi:YeiH family protein [Deinococcus lacus]|uniref:YeiH family protein n=1 Tax=Deinococcus lacus TaxID=392561 RepID=A0ABW1YIJ9_9DEIO